MYIKERASSEAEQITRVEQEELAAAASAVGAQRSEALCFKAVYSGRASILYREARAFGFALEALPERKGETDSLVIFKCERERGRYKSDGCPSRLRRIFVILSFL